MMKGNCFEVCIFVEEVFHLIKNYQDFDIIIIRISFIKELKIESLLIIAEHSCFEECIFIKELFKILNSEMKVDLIIKFFKLVDIFFYLISRVFFIIIK